MSGMFDCGVTSIKLGPKFTKWLDNAELPYGNWTNGSITKTSEELISEYPSHAAEWAGVWTRE